MEKDNEHNSRGFLYAAIGDKYVREAIISAHSVRSHMPAAKIAICSTVPVEDKVFDQVIIVDKSAEGFKGVKLYKPLALLSSPFDATVFLDSDTYMCDDCNELFQMSQHVELVLAHDTADMSIPRVGETAMKNFYPYNSGVISFRKSPSTKAFLERWQQILEEEFKEHPWDQRAMMASILELGIRTYTLQPVYNCRTNFIVSLPQLPVKIIHGRDINFVEVEQELNRVIKNRVWMPKRNKVILKKQRNLLQEIWHKIKNRLKK